MCRSRAPIRAALRFVEIANMAICDRNSPAVLREHAQFGPQWFVMSVHSPQQTINNWAPRAVTVVSQAKISDESSLSRTGMAGQKPPEERERVCAFRGCGLVGSRSLALLRQNNAEPCARTVHTLRIAGRGWHISGLVGVATSTLGPLFGRVGQPWVCKDTVNVFCLLSISLATLDPAVRVVCVRR